MHLCSVPHEANQVQNDTWRLYSYLQKWHLFGRPSTVFERLPPSRFGQERPTADMSRLPVNSVGHVGIPYQYPCPGDFCTMPIRSGMCNAPQNQIAHPLPITAEVS